MNQSMFLKIYIIPCLIISPIFSISCNSWFSIWMTMEFNLLTFIPLLMYNNNHKELCMKYFIIQTIGSSTLLLSTNFLLINLNYKFYYIEMFISLMNLSLILKMGAAPLHLWFINMMKNMNWMNCMILSTWQKIIPMMMLFNLFNVQLIYIIIIISSFTGAIFGLNQQSLRLILGYSSINHISWLLMNMMTSQNMWILYFFSYSLINISIMSLFNSMKIFYINQLFFMNNLLKTKIFLIMNFISMCGLPPTFGFLMKWMTIYMTNWKNSSIIILIMIFMSIMTFIFYIQVCISLFLNLNLNNKMNLPNKFINQNKISLDMIIMMMFWLNLWIMSLWLS